MLRVWRGRVLIGGLWRGLIIGLRGRIVLLMGWMGRILLVRVRLISVGSSRGRAIRIIVKLVDVEAGGSIGMFDQSVCRGWISLTDLTKCDCSSVLPSCLVVDCSVEKFSMGFVQCRTSHLALSNRCKGSLP